MKLTEYLTVSTDTRVTNSTAGTRKKNETGFDSYLKAEERAGTDKTAASPREIQAKNTEKDVESGQKAPTQAKTAKDGAKTEKTVDAAKTEAKPANAPAEKPKAAAETDMEGLAAETLFAEIAALLGIMPAELMQMLSEMGIESPEAITPEVAVKLAQAVLGAATPVELLWKPDAAKTIDAINNAVREWKAAKPETNGEGLGTTPEKRVYAAEDGAKSETVYESETAADSKIKTPEGTIDNDAEGEEYAEEVPVRGETPPERHERAERHEVREQEPNADVQTVRPEQANHRADPRQEQKPGTRDAEVNHNPFARDENIVTPAQLNDIRQTVESGRATTDTVEVVKQIVEMMKAEVRMDTTELRLTLKPESLGEVSMRISTQNGIVTAQFYAENQRVKEIIESQFNELKNALAEKGVEVASMSAFVGRDDRDGYQSGAEPGGRGRQSGTRISAIMNRNNAYYAAEETGETDGDATDAEGNALEVNIRA